MKLTEDELKYIMPDGATTVLYGQRGLNVFGKLHYFKIVAQAYFKINAFYKKALKDKECFYGPFKGEFGHFLLHTLPFLMHLHQQGVKIHYCGMALHKPFLVDEQGNSIIYKFYELRDFFSETPPHANQVVPPIDVREEILKFQELALKSGKAYLNIGDNNLYWFVFRNWQLKKGRQHIYSIEKGYKTAEENSCVIFPRKKGIATVTPNNGGPWDYMEIARAVSPYFDKVYITGHPSMSADVVSEENIEACLSPDNKVVIEKCCNANLIISQHSGAVHIGMYTNTNVLLIFNGKPPIKGLIDTLRFRENLSRQKLNFAFDLLDIHNFVKKTGS